MTRLKRASSVRSDSSAEQWHDANSDPNTPKSQADLSSVPTSPTFAATTPRGGGEATFSAALPAVPEPVPFCPAPTVPAAAADAPAAGTAPAAEVLFRPTARRGKSPRGGVQCAGRAPVHDGVRHVSLCASGAGAAHATPPVDTVRVAYHNGRPSIEWRDEYAGLLWPHTVYR